MSKDQEINPPNEFTERVSRLLLVCVQGIMELLDKTDNLFPQLQSLTQVIRKAVRPKPPEGLAKEVQDYFVRLRLEKEFRGAEQNEMKQIVVDLTETIMEMAGNSGQFTESIGEQIAKVKAATSLQDILAIKEEIVFQTEIIRNKSLSLRKELEEFHEITHNLSQRLEQSEARVLIDPLTNVFNRNAYEVKITQVVREFNRYGDGFSLVVVDIDHFKNFNDTYGHQVGDQVLISVASTLREAVRTTDQVYRYGGEEFAILLVKIDPENAAKLAKKILTSVEKDYFVFKDQKLNVTISVGLANLQKDDTASTWFDRADKAMYEAKKAGRNRMVVAP